MAWLDQAGNPRTWFLSRSLRFDLANLEGANLKGARYDMNTTWPRWFNKKAAGVIFG